MRKKIEEVMCKVKSQKSELESILEETYPSAYMENL